MTASPETLAAFATMIASASTWGAMDASDVSAFRAAGGADLCRAVADVTVALPAAAATSFLGARSGGNWNWDETWIPDTVSSPCSYGQAARLLANRMGVTL